MHETVMLLTGIMLIIMLIFVIAIIIIGGTYVLYMIVSTCYMQLRVDYLEYRLYKEKLKQLKC